MQEEKMRIERLVKVAQEIEHRDESLATKLINGVENMALLLQYLPPQKPTAQAM